MVFFSLNPSILFICSLGFLPVRSLVCNSEVFGNPKVEDCSQALLEIPFARRPPGSFQSRYPHFFAEPQFQEPPFHLVTNNYRPQAIIQIPKIWKRSKSHPQNPISAVTNLQFTIAQLAENQSQTPAA